MNDSPDALGTRFFLSLRLAAVCVLGITGSAGCGSDSAASPQPSATGAGASAGGVATSGGNAGAGAGGAGLGASAAGSGSPAVGPIGRSAGAGAAAPMPAAGSGTVGSAGSTAAPAAGSGAAPTEPADPAAVRCKPRAFTQGEARLHMHHIHFNTQDPDGQIAFVQKFFDAQPVDFCTDETSPRTTRAAKTERAFFLYTKTAAPPSDMRLNRLAHVGYNTPDVQAELDRLNALGVPLADTSVCATAADGTPCNTFNVLWFYVETPETARFEIASGPGPSTSGFSHIHLVAPTYSFFQNVIGEAFQDPNGNPNVDGVNMVNTGRTGVLDETITYEDTRGAPVDHVGLSTTDLEGELARIEATGVKIEEPISFKPEYGFRSFMVRSPEGVWLEILEDAPFAP